jgi:hypothetical protein
LRKRDAIRGPEGLEQLQRFAVPVDRKASVVDARLVDPHQDAARRDGLGAAHEGECRGQSGQESRVGEDRVGVEDAGIAGRGVEFCDRDDLRSRARVQPGKEIRITREAAGGVNGRIAGDVARRAHDIQRIDRPTSTMCHEHLRFDPRQARPVR